MPKRMIKMWAEALELPRPQAIKKLKEIIKFKLDYYRSLKS